MTGFVFWEGMRLITFFLTLLHALGSGVRAAASSANATSLGQPVVSLQEQAKDIIQNGVVDICEGKPQSPSALEARKAFRDIQCTEKNPPHHDPASLKGQVLEGELHTTHEQGSNKTTISALCPDYRTLQDILDDGNCKGVNSSPPISSCKCPDQEVSGALSTSTRAIILPFLSATVAAALGFKS
jgi:hypothetical protein